MQLVDHARPCHTVLCRFGRFTPPSFDAISPPCRVGEDGKPVVSAIGCPVLVFDHISRPPRPPFEEESPYYHVTVFRKTLHVLVAATAVAATASVAAERSTEKSDHDLCVPTWVATKQATTAAVSTVWHKLVTGRWGRCCCCRCIIDVAIWLMILRNC